MKRFKQFLIVVAVVISADLGDASAYKQATEWEKTFGGSNYDYGRSVQQTSDGGYIIVGETQSFGVGKYDIYLIKTNPSGNLQWEKTFGGSDDDRGLSVQQTSDGGYIVVGYTNSFGAGRVDAYLIKTDPNGELQWQKTFGGSNDDFGTSVQQTSDGGYIVVGSTWSMGAGKDDVYLVKTEPNGNCQWQKTFGGSKSDWGLSIQITADGGYIISGRICSFEKGDPNVYLIKADISGNKEWEKNFGTSGEDVGRSVRQTSDGGYIIAGETQSSNSGKYHDDVYLIKTDSSGNNVWYRTFGGNALDCGYSVQQTTDGGYIIAGATWSFGKEMDHVYLIKTDSSGNRQWEKTFGVSKEDCALSVQQTSDGGYIIAGWTTMYGKSDVYLIKTDSR